MNRRSFFSIFASLVAAIPIAGKLVRRRRTILNPAYDAAGNMTLQIRNFKAENYIGTWRWASKDENGKWVEGKSAWDVLRKCTKV